MGDLVCNRINPVYPSIATAALGMASLLTDYTNVLSREMFCKIEVHFSDSLPIMGNDIQVMSSLGDGIRVTTYCGPSLRGGNETLNLFEPIFNSKVLFWGTVCLFTLTVGVLACRKFKVCTSNSKQA